MKYLLILLMPCICLAQTDVYIANFEPDVIIDSGNVTGFGIEIWETVAKDIGIDYEYHIVDFSEIVPTLAKEKNAVAVAGLSIKADREKIIDYSEHYLDAGFSIAVNESSETPTMAKLSVYKPLLKPILGFVVFIIFFAHIVWLAEKKKESISDKYFPGIFEAIYFCIVTASTVGYGDYTPKKWIGRTVTIVLIVAGIIVFCNFTAILAADYTVNSLEGDIKGPEDLRGKDVAVLHATTSIGCVKQLGATPKVVISTPQMYVDLVHGQVDAVVFDTPSVKYSLKTLHTHNIPDADFSNLKLISENFEKEYYGFGLSEEHPLKEQIDQAILRLKENGTYDIIYKKWFE